MPPVALIDRVEAAVAGIAHTQAAPANAANQQALQQTKALSGWSREDFAIGPVPRQPLAVGEKLIPGDITWMVPRNDDAPLILWHEAGPAPSSTDECRCRLGATDVDRQSWRSS